MLSLLWSSSETRTFFSGGGLKKASRVRFPVTPDIMSFGRLIEIDGAWVLRRETRLVGEAIYVPSKAGTRVLQTSGF
jgi:hypothetical protein